ncbi:MAG: plastocyanin/azurin family copper-binding protein [Thermoleophilia bacterium]
MKRRRLAGLAVVAVTALVVVPTSFAAKKKPATKLAASFSGMTITLAKGKTVLSSGSQGSASLKAGRYALQLKDDDTFHNFVLVKAASGSAGSASPVRAAGRPVETSVGGTGTKTFTVVLARGTYTLYCAPHLGLGMYVQITVR